MKKEEKLSDKLSKKQRAAAMSLGLQGENLELFLRGFPKVNKENKDVISLLFQKPNPNCVTLTTLGLWLDKELSTQKFLRLYGTHINKCKKCLKLWKYYQSLKAKL